MSFKPSTKTRITTIEGGQMLLLDTGTALYHITVEQLINLAIENSPGGVSRFVDLQDVLFSAFTGIHGKLLGIREDGAGIVAVDKPVVDSVLNSSSTNAIRNMAVYWALQAKSSVGHGHAISEITNLGDELFDRPRFDELGYLAFKNLVGSTDLADGSLLYEHLSTDLQNRLIQVVDNLLSTDPSAALSAAQGKILNDKIEAVWRVEDKVATYANLPTTALDQQNYLVEDASGDPTVTSGWAIYRSMGNQGDPGAYWLKTQEGESVDLVVLKRWEELEGLPADNAALVSYVKASAESADFSTGETGTADFFGAAKISIGVALSILKNRMLNTYTKTEVTTAIKEDAQAADFDTGEQEVEGFWGAAQVTIATALAIIKGKFNEYYTKLQLDPLFSNRYTKAEADAAIETQAEQADFNTDDTTYWGGGIISIASALLRLKEKIGSFTYGNGFENGVKFLSGENTAGIAWDRDTNRFYFVGDGTNPYMDLSKDGRVLVESDLPAYLQSLPGYAVGKVLSATETGFAWVTATTGGTTNTAPTANAGADQVITLPTNSIQLNGSGSDADGTIAAYLWEKISGPAATLSGVNTATLSVSDMLEGSYTFRITVTDNEGATASDDVVITVNPEQNTGDFNSTDFNSTDFNT